MLADDQPPPGFDRCPLTEADVVAGVAARQLFAYEVRPWDGPRILESTEFSQYPGHPWHVDTIGLGHGRAWAAGEGWIGVWTRQPWSNLVGWPASARRASMRRWMAHQMLNWTRRGIRDSPASPASFGDALRVIGGVPLGRFGPLHAWIWSPGDELVVVIAAVGPLAPGEVSFEVCSDLTPYVRGLRADRPRRRA
jgi:hypothetical protein